MKKVIFPYYNWYGVEEEELTVIDGFGVIDDAAITVFSQGQCHSLALAIHKLTGWRIIGAGGPDPNSPWHCLVYHPTRKGYIDIKGFREHHGQRRVVNKRLPLKTINKGMDKYLPLQVEDAIPFAKTVLRDLGENFV